MKKRFLIMVCVLLLALTAGCGKDSTPDTTGETVHTHTPSAVWDRDAKEHWHVCECGEKLDAAEHELVENVCAVCGSEVQEFDGLADVYDYNEQGEMIRWSSYDGAGTMVADWKYEFQYDGDGNQVGGKTYENGVLVEESEYTVDSGVSVLTKTTSYFEDGGWFINEYDEFGNVTVLMSYDADGALTLEGHYEFALTADGESYTSKATERYDDGSQSVAEYNEFGDQIGRILYDADGNVEIEEIYEWEYGEEGDWLSCKVYENGVLTRQTQYVTAEDENSRWTYPAVITDYHEDGSRTVSEYNENDELISETTYDAE